MSYSTRSRDAKELATEMLRPTEIPGSTNHAVATIATPAVGAPFSCGSSVQLNSYLGTTFFSWTGLWPLALFVTVPLRNAYGPWVQIERSLRRIAELIEIHTSKETSNQAHPYKSCTYPYYFVPYFDLSDTYYVRSTQQKQKERA